MAFVLALNFITMTPYAGYIVVGFVISLIGITSGYTKKKASLTSVPHNLIQDTETSIDLSYNNIEVLGDNEFSKYTSLVTLILSRNKIIKVSSTAFNGTILKYLHLYGNKLTYIPNLSSINSTLETLHL